MKWTEEYIERFRTQTLYLIDFETDIIIKSVPDDGYYMNFNLRETKTSWENDIVFRADTGGRMSNEHQYKTVGIHVVE